MSNALLPSWANGTVKEAADMLARTALEKRAAGLGSDLVQSALSKGVAAARPGMGSVLRPGAGAIFKSPVPFNAASSLLSRLKGMGGQVKNWAQVHPDIAAPLGVAGGAALLGGGLAGLSSFRQPKEERQTLRSMLRGALAGGALGGGGYFAAKSVGLDKKIPGLLGKANNKVTEMITGAPAPDAPAAVAGGAPAAAGGSAPTAEAKAPAPVAVDPAIAAEEAARKKNTDIIAKSKEDASNEFWDDIYGKGKKRVADGWRAFRDGTTEVVGETLQDAVWSPEAAALGVTGAGDVALRRFLRNKITSSPDVAVRGAERLMAGTDWQKKMPKHWVEQLPHLQSAAEGPELAAALKALKNTKGLQSAALGTEAELSRGLAARVSRAGRGAGGKLGKALAVLPYILALGAPTLAESASPVIRDALTSASTGPSSTGKIPTFIPN